MSVVVRRPSGPVEQQRPCLGEICSTTCVSICILAVVPDTATNQKPDVPLNVIEVPDSASGDQVSTRRFMNVKKTSSDGDEVS